MKYNINVIKSVWRRLRKPSRAMLDAICSKDAVYSEVLSKNGHFLGEAETPLESKEFPRTTAIAAARITTRTVLVRHGNGSLAHAEYETLEAAG